MEILFRDFTVEEKNDPGQFEIQNISDDRIEVVASAEGGDSGSDLTVKRSDAG